MFTPASLERIGSVIGARYELRDAIGQGASAVLYAAQDRLLGREVCVKVMRKASAFSEPEARARFQREAQTLARLRHPHLVEVFDVGEATDGAPFVVMELLRGETLAQRLARTPSLSADEVLALMLPLMGALACVHDAGVIHRDIKPANIFLVRRGDAVVPKLLDFGIAKLPDAPQVTGEGMTIGTPAFMSPEHARGQRLTPAADVWSMGIVLFTCLAGRMPFQGLTPVRLLLQVAEQCPPRLNVPGLDPAIAQVVDRALAVDVGRRLPTMRALARCLVHTACRAGVALPVDPDPVGLAEYPSWCLAAAAEYETEELPVLPSEDTAPEALSPRPLEALPGPARSAADAHPVSRARRAAGLWRLAAPLVLGAFLGAAAQRSVGAPEAGPAVSASLAPGTPSPVAEAAFVSPATRLPRIAAPVVRLPAAPPFARLETTFDRTRGDSPAQHPSTRDAQARVPSAR